MAMATAARVMFWFPGDGAVTRFAASLVCAVLYNTAGRNKGAGHMALGFQYPSRACIQTRESKSVHYTRYFGCIYIKSTGSIED